jgi:hypothetical protein
MTSKTPCLSGATFAFDSTVNSSHLALQSSFSQFSVNLLGCFVAASQLSFKRIPLSIQSVMVLLRVLFFQLGNITRSLQGR